MRGNGSLGSCSRNTRNYSYRCRNNDDKSSGGEVLEVFLGEESCGHMYLETSLYSSSNGGGHESCGQRSQDTIKITSSNSRGHGYRSSLNSHSSSSNSAVCVDKGGSKSQGYMYGPVWVALLHFTSFGFRTTNDATMISLKFSTGEFICNYKHMDFKMYNDSQETPTYNELVRFLYVYVILFTCVFKSFLIRARMRELQG